MTEPEETTGPTETTTGAEPVAVATPAETAMAAAWHRLSWLDCLPVAAVLILSVIVSLPSLPDSVCYGDFGDLQLASITLGIMHPPGYAGFVAVGHLATWMPGVDPAYMVSLACLGSALVVLWLCVMLQVRLGVNVWLAGAAALCLTAHPRMWMSMVAPEIYMPALALLGASIYLFVKYTRTGMRRDLFIAALLYGIALANRPPVLFALPFFLIVWWVAQRKRDPSPRAAVRSMLIVTGLALLPVVFNLGYLWVQDKPDSAYNYIELYNLQWKRLPHTTEGTGARVRRVIWHATGEQFSEYMGSTWPEAKAKLRWVRYDMFPQLERFMVVAVSILLFGVHGFFAVAMATVVFGAAVAYRRCRASFLLLAGAGLSQVVFVCQYHVYGQSADILPTYFAAVIFGGVAFSSLLRACLMRLFQSRAREEAVRFRAPNRSLTVAARFVITLLIHPLRACLRWLFQSRAREEAVRFHARNRSLTVAARFVIALLIHPLSTPKVVKFVGVAMFVLMVRATIQDIPNRPEIGKDSDATGWIDELDMQTLPENAVIAAGWRYWPPLRYAQIVRANRPDIHLINADPRNWMAMVEPLGDRPIFFARKFSIHDHIPKTKYRNIFRLTRDAIAPSGGSPDIP